MIITINEELEPHIELIYSNSQNQGMAQGVLDLQCWLPILQWSNAFLRAPITSWFLKL